MPWGVAFGACLLLTSTTGLPSTSQLRIAVVFSGHPRSFLEKHVRTNIRRRALGPLCADVLCDVFMLVSLNDATLFDNSTRARVMARNTTAEEVERLLESDGGWGMHSSSNSSDGSYFVDMNNSGNRAALSWIMVRQVRGILNPPPRARRPETCNWTRPAFAYGYELANVATAFNMVTSSETKGGFRYDGCLRMRFDVVWIRPPPPIPLLLRARSIVIPRHHFPVNNHLALMPRALAEAYFEAPLKLWSSCENRWGEPGKMLENPEGILLKSLLDLGINIRRELGLYMTIYRPALSLEQQELGRDSAIHPDHESSPALAQLKQGGAECARLLAYRTTAKARTVATECTCQFSSVDPMVSKKSTHQIISANQTDVAASDNMMSAAVQVGSTGKASMLYTFGDIIRENGDEVQIAVSEDTYQEDIEKFCSAIEPTQPEASRRCLMHKVGLERAFDIISRSRAHRNILWEDSLISSAKFAEFEINSLSEWNKWVRDPGQFFQINVDELETELDDIGVDESCAALANGEARLSATLLQEERTREDATAPGNCSPIECTVYLDGVDRSFWLGGSKEVATQVELFCAKVDLQDSQCDQLLAHAKTLWMTQRGHCKKLEDESDDVHVTAKSDGTLETSTYKLRLPEGWGPNPSNSSPSPFDSLFDASRSRPVAPRGRGVENHDWLPQIWRQPSQGIALKLARDVTAPWRAWGITQEQVELAASSDTDCALLQILDGTLKIRADTSVLAAWNRSSEARPWRSRRRTAVIDLIASVAPLIGRDLEMAFCPSDCVVSSTPTSEINVNFFRHHKARLDVLPALTLVGCAGSHNIPFPVFDVRSHDLNESLPNWDTVVTDTLEPNRASRPWNTRDSRAVFRGQTKGQSCWSRDRRDGIAAQHGLFDLQGLPACGRRRLHVLASMWPRRFDVAYDHIPLLRQEDYRYQIYAEGHCGWADRLRFILFFKIGLFLQETFCREFFSLGLQPWIHYLPIDYHFDNLVEIHEWAETHVAALERIITNMNAYAAAMLSGTSIRSYAISVLIELSLSLRYKPRPRDSMMSVSDYNVRFGCQ